MIKFFLMLPAVMSLIVGGAKRREEVGGEALALLDGWRSVCSFVVYSPALSPANTAKCTHTHSHTQTHM